jgi:hypothetical protein
MVSSFSLHRQQQFTRVKHHLHSLDYQSEGLYQRCHPREESNAGRSLDLPNAFPGE